MLKIETGNDRLSMKGTFNPILKVIVWPVMVIYLFNRVYKYKSRTEELNVRDLKEKCVYYFYDCDYLTVDIHVCVSGTYSVPYR